MKDGEYIEEMKEMKAIYESKNNELELSEKDLNFYKNEILSIYGVIRLLSKSAKYDFLELDTLMNSLSLMEYRLEKLVEMVMGESDID